MRPQPPVITIDGASGTGKGVVTQRVAKALGWHFLDSGALYRVLALAAAKHQVPLDDEERLAVLAQGLAVRFKEAHIGDAPRIILEGHDVTEDIRTEQVGNQASKASAWPMVRTALLSRQRAFRQSPGLVTDGRDMGTVIFPDAFCKIFLQASPEIRAERRFKQLKEKGIHVNLSALVEEQAERDHRDRTRSVAPLKPAPDAVCIDTDQLTIEEVVARIMTEVRKIFP